jgi:hypothetical protein
MTPEKTQKKILKDALQNEVRPLVLSLKEVIKDGNKLLKQLNEKEIPIAEPIDLTPLIKKLETLTEEVKKKEDYTYEIKVDPSIKKQIQGKQGIRGLRGLRGVQGRKGKDGKDAVVDVAGIKKAVTPIKGKDYFDGKKGDTGASGAEITATEIRNKLESLKGKSRLSIKAIKGIEDIVKAEIHKNYSSGSYAGGNGGGGSAGSTNNFADNEIPTGTQNGINLTFNLMHTPLTGTVHLYYNGLRQTPVNDFTVSGTVITFVSAPIASDNILVDYQY